MSLVRRLLALSALSLVPSALAAQWGSVNITSPANGAHFTSSSVAVSWHGCANVTPTSYGTYVNGSGVTTTFVTNGCFDYSIRRRHSATASLTPGANTIKAEICHNTQSTPCYSHTITVYYDTPGINTTPDGGTASTIVDGGGGSYGFTVQNTGALTGTAQFTPSCSGPLTSCSADQSSLSLSPGQSTTVTVSYTGSGTGTGSIGLNATYSEYPSAANAGSATVTVNPKPVATVVVTRTGAATIGVGQSSGFTARTYAGDGSELTGRSVSWSGSNVSVSPSSGSSQASTTATGTGAGTGTVYATSEGIQGSATVSVVNPTYAVSVWTNASNPVTPAAGATSTGNVAYFVTNNSTYTSSSSTFTVSASGVSPISCSGSTTVTLAPGEQSDPILFNCSIGATTTTMQRTVTVTASTSSPASFSGSHVRTYNLGPNYAVNVVAEYSSVPLGPRATGGSTTFRVYNNSTNAGGSASITWHRNCSAGSTAVICPSPGGSVTVSEGQFAIVTAGFDVAWVGVNGSIGVTAVLGGASASASIPVTTTPDYKVIVTRTNASQTLGGGATSGSTTFSVFNNSTNTGTNTTFALTPTCTGPFVIASGCNASPPSVTLGDQSGTAAGAITLGYNTQLTGQTGSVTLQASASSPGSSSHAQTTDVHATPVYAVSVAPQGSSQNLGAQSTAGSSSFTVTNTSTNTSVGVLFEFGSSCSPTLVTNCAVSGGSVTLTQGGNVTRTVTYDVNQSDTQGSAGLSAWSNSPSIGSNAAQTLTITPHYAVSVVPSAPSQHLGEEAPSGSSGFTVTNTSKNIGGSITFDLTAACHDLANSGGCAPSVGSVTLSRLQSATPSVGFTVNPVPTSGWARLTASTANPSSFSGQGTQDLTITPHYAVAVTPAAPNPQTLGERVTGESSGFTVQNNSKNVGSSITFDLSSPTCGIPMSGCAPSASQVTLGYAGSAPVTVSYSVGPTGTSGTVALRAYTTVPSTFEATGAKTVNATPSYSIAVSPASASATRFAGTSHTHSATITNTSWNTDLPISVGLAPSGCGEVYVGGCSTPSGSTSLAQGASTTAIALSYSALQAGMDTVNLIASGSVSGGATVTPTNGALIVTVNGNTIVATTAGINPRATIARGGCLTIAAGQNAAYECGDLRVVHPLPGTITMGKGRAPTLIYNSRHAKPGVLLAANVMYGGPDPLTIEATVTISGEAGSIVKSFPWASACNGVECRIVVPIDANPNMGTGLYQANLQLRAKHGANTYATSGMVSDTVIFVNRAKSPYGAGWWVDGLEWMAHYGSSNKVFWLGGDGSTRLYQSTADPNVYVAQSYDRPDTLLHVGSLWRRQLGNGAYVEFDNAGRHIKTVNSLGHQTTFSYHESMVGTPLATVTLPVQSGGPSHVYSFSYALNESSEPALSGVSAPQAAFTRAVSTSRANHFDITGITDADGNTTEFGYDAVKRLTTRRNKLNDTTFFAYDDGGALKQAKLSTARTYGADSNITTNFRAAETRGAYSSTDTPTLLAKAYTHLDGPRTVADTTIFFVNRWGTPDTIYNALGQRTRILERDATFPALAKATVGPNGVEQRAYYNGRALVDSTITLNPYGDGRNPKTSYRWHPSLTSPVLVIAPTLERDTMDYNANGTLAWRQPGTSSSRRVHFEYNGYGQVSATVDQFGARDSVFYDAAGNVIKTRTSLGIAAEYFKDALGRDTLTLTPTDSLQTPSLKQRHRTVYNARDLVDSTIAVGPAVSYTLQWVTPDAAPVTPDSVFTRHTYDAEGKTLSSFIIATEMGPNPETINVLESWTYDAAGRVRRHVKNARTDSTYYDAAGNVVRTRSAGGNVTTAGYDALSRAIYRTTSAKSYPKRRCEGMQPGPETDPINPGLCFLVFPAYPTESDGSIEFDADSAIFAYDAAGNAITADNRYARIHRAFYPNGAIKNDSSWYRAANNASFEHLAVIKSHYDLSGRRDTLTLPGGQQIAYTYSPEDGALTSIVDPYSTTYRYVYDAAGRVDSLVIGADAIREKRWYDADHRQYARHRTSAAYVSTESLKFDAQGRVILAVSGTSANGAHSDSTKFTYSGLGAVIARERFMLGTTNWETEEFRVDGLGNVMRGRFASRDFAPSQPQIASYGKRGDLKDRTAIDDPVYTQKWDKLVQEFDADGQLTMSHHLVRDQAGNPTTDNPTRHYYGGDGRLRAMHRHNQGRGAWEEYRYDALGRRVMVITRLGGETEGCDLSGLTFCNPVCTASATGDCEHKVTWAVWDGDRLLREERRPYPDGTGTGVRYGVVAYVHGLELDHPLAVLKGGVRVLNPDWRGMFEASVTASGASADCSLPTGGFCDHIPWPAGQPVYARSPGFEPGSGIVTHTWSGSLLLDGQDVTGNLYRRNRFYDPIAGRFTQEDPIGLAGGMNLYGFAGGDPINHSDPFGLCPPVWLCRLANAAAGFGDAVTGGATHIIREAIDANGVINRGSGSYIAGMAAGVAAGAVTLGTVTAAVGAGGQGHSLSDATVVVRGGTGPMPAAGETFSGAAGATLMDAASGVPHGTIRSTTAGEIRAGGGSVTSAPERTRSGVMNDKHVNICLGSGKCPFGPPQPNPVPKANRIK